MTVMNIDINLSTKRGAKSMVPNIIAIGALVLAAAYTWHNVELYNFNLERIAGLSARLAGLEQTLGSKPSPVPAATREDVKLLKDEVGYINNLIARETFSWTGLLTGLEQNVPAGVSIVRISPEFETRTIRVSGLAKSIKDVFKFVDGLGGSEKFSEVFLLKHEDAVKKEDKGKSFISFDISARYISGEVL